jgi:hypothetical protein
MCLQPNNESCKISKSNKNKRYGIAKKYQNKHDYEDNNYVNEKK